MQSYSYSQLQLYRRCPRQYEFAYLKKLSRQISAGESFGSSVHNTLKKWGELEMRYQEDVLSGQLEMFESTADTDLHELNLEFLLTLWHKSFIVQGYDTRLEADFARQKGDGLLSQFFDWWKKEERKVVTVEKGFSLQLDSIKLSGRFDRVEEVEGELHVIDYKTGKSKSQEEVDADLQLSIYALAAEKQFGKPCAKLTLLFLYEGEVIAMSTERSQGQLQDAEKQLLHICEEIESGNMHPTPSKEVCRCCPYKSVCDVAAV